MFAATQSPELRFHFVDRRDLMPLGYDMVRRDTGERVGPEDIVRAFEIEKGRYVPLEPEDLDRLDVELTRAIDICDFVELDEIDPISFRQAYYLAPKDGVEKPFRLLARALAETGRRELLDLIHAKAEGMPLPRSAAEEEGEVVDLVQALRESVEHSQRRRARKAS